MAEDDNNDDDGDDDICILYGVMMIMTNLQVFVYRTCVLLLLSFQKKNDINLGAKSARISLSCDDREELAKSG